MSIWDLLKEPNYLFAALTGGWAYFLYDYLGPVFAVRMADLDCSQMTIGLFFMIGALTNICSSLSFSFFSVKM